MASQWIFQKINDKPTKLARPLVAGSSIFFTSTSFDPKPDPSAAIDNSSFNLEDEKNVLLHISTRRGKGEIVLDTKRGDTWDNKLQKIDLKDISTGSDLVIRVTVTAKSYDISFNNSPKIYTFDKRIEANATAVSYGLNKGQRAVYSNPVVIQVFDNGTAAGPPTVSVE
uniref:Galectin n=1 Tax=Peltigera membranacea TaxID=161997 RepID=L7S0M7_9LECA|nr:galectin-like protein [Peltigera membranacea]